MKTNPLQIYIHIPFCVAKCAYCDFLSAPATEETKESYVKALCAEIEGRKAEYSGRPITSVFLGGGTPSCLSGDQLEGIFRTLRQCMELTKDAEITVEVNPGTVDREKMICLKECGVNRLSIGLQSAHNEELRLLHRIHTVEEFSTCFTLAREAGFRNLNVDLISSIPGQSKESFWETLAYVQGLENPPEHISVYSLIIEEGTPFYEWYHTRPEAFLSEEEDRELYHATREWMEQKGYNRYEISNYAKDGYACRHNMGYWTGAEYLGFGIGAASYMNRERFVNRSDLSAYLENPMTAREVQERLKEVDCRSEFMILGLRMCKGISMSEFQSRFGKSLESVFGKQIDRSIAEGLLERKEDRIFLTPFGLDVCNVVFERFLPD